MFIQYVDNNTASSGGTASVAALSPTYLPFLTPAVLLKSRATVLYRALTRPLTLTTKGLYFSLFCLLSLLVSLPITLRKRPSSM